MKYLEKIQTLLPLGYLYLIVLGLLKQSILYYQLGMNILDHSSISDILMSPMSDLASNPVLGMAVFLLCGLLLIVLSLLIRYSHKGWAQKMLVSYRLDPGAGKTEMQKAMVPVFVAFVALLLMSLFIGLGVGQGGILARRISQSDYNYNYKVNFNSGKPEEVFIFGKNSLYYFYAIKGSKTIKIAPVATITSLELINNKKLQ